MSEPDGLRECCCPPANVGDGIKPQRDCPARHEFPAPEPDAGGVEALGEVAALARLLNHPPRAGDHARAHAILTSDWLAAHDAATAERVWRETAEGIAEAIESLRPVVFALGSRGPTQMVPLADVLAALPAREATR